jgi:hypothetical protein
MQGNTDRIAALRTKGSLNDKPVWAAIKLKTTVDPEDAKDRITQQMFKLTGFLSSVNRKADRILEEVLEIKYRNMDDSVIVFFILNTDCKYAVRFLPIIKNLYDAWLAASPEPTNVEFNAAFEYGPDDIAEFPNLLLIEPLIEALQISLNIAVGKRVFKNLSGVL